MRIALIADIHSNITALEAVLKAIRSHSPDQIISLGDQVNLGPCPRETLDLLRAEGVTCLHGNHERYILSAMAGDPGYDGANFAALRYGARGLTSEEITFPKEMRMGSVTLCHAMPGDDRFPVFDEETALDKLSAMRFDEPTHIICGHGHNPTHLRCGNVTVDSIGAVGCMDNGVPGTAPFVILTEKNGHAMLRPYYTAYDTSVLKGQFIRSGMAEHCPVMAHIICLQMMFNRDYIVEFVAGALSISKQKGERVISQESWLEMDRRFDWPDGVDTAEFWHG